MYGVEQGWHRWMRSPVRMAWRCAFAGETDCVPRARHVVEALFSGTGREDDAGLVVTEFSANALRHTRSGGAGGWFGVEVCMPDDSPAYLGVLDLGGFDRPRFDLSLRSREVVEGGRGLAIARSLAVEVGVTGSPALGHVVWARLDVSKAK